MSRQTVLITGAAGYIGSVMTARFLAEGFRVIAVDNLIYDNAHAILPFLSDPNDQLYEFHKEDVQNTAAIARLAKRADTIILLAALVGVPACDKDTRSNEYAHSVNWWSVKPLVESLSPAQRVLYPNTNSGYGQTDGNSYCTEDDPLSPISTYGSTKCGGEKVVLEHPNSVVFRLATVFGASPRMRLDLMVNDFTARLCAIRDGKRFGIGNQPKPFNLYEPHFKRNFVGVRDVAEAFLFMTTIEQHTGVFNLGLPTANLTKMELAHAICDTIGLSRGYVKVGEGTDPDKRNYLVSNRKILDTGFVFRHQLADGIREVARIAELFSGPDLARMRNA